MDKLLVIDGTKRLGAKGSEGGMAALKNHEFFRNKIDFNGDMANLGIKELLVETEP